MQRRVYRLNADGQQRRLQVGVGLEQDRYVTLCRDCLARAGGTRSEEGEEGIPGYG